MGYFRRIQISKLKKEWSKYVKKTWKLPYKTHCCLIPFTADCVPKDTLMHERYYTFFVINLGIEN